MSYGLKPVHKAGRLQDWCEGDGDEGEDAGLETPLAADEVVDAATDAYALVAAKMAKEAAELTGCRWVGSSSAGGGGSSAGV